MLGQASDVGDGKQRGGFGALWRESREVAVEEYCVASAWMGGLRAPLFQIFGLF